MSAILAWTTKLGEMPVFFIVSCGNTDIPIGEDALEPPIELRTHIASQILGDWRLVDIIWLKDGAVIKQIDGAGWVYGTRVYLTLAPVGVFGYILKISHRAGILRYPSMETQRTYPKIYSPLQR